MSQLSFSTFDVAYATDARDCGADLCHHHRHPDACEQCDDDRRAEDRGWDQLDEDRAAYLAECGGEAENDSLGWDGAA